MDRFIDWMREDKRTLWDVDLTAYRDYLLAVGGNDGNGLAPPSVAAHLSTVRGQYRRILRNKQVKALMYQYASMKLQSDGIDDDPANRKAIVDEMRTAIQDAIHPDSATVTVITDQDPTHLRLTIAQANRLMRQPDKLRDQSVIALLLATGIREGELVNVRVGDLRSRMDDSTLALFVRKGKGSKKRKVPYGEHEGVLRIIDRWITQEGISDNDARVFAITTKTVQRILARYPIMIDGELVTVRPHDCRRTYARRVYEAGMDLTAVQQNLGHVDPRTTLGYIGTLDADARKPKAVFNFDLEETMHEAVHTRHLPYKGE